MAIVSPALVTYRVAQDATTTVTLTPAEDASAWTVQATLRAYNGGPALATKTVGSGIVGSNLATTPVWVITWAAADLTLTPGAYVWEFVRTDVAYSIVEPSAFLLTPASATAYPTLTNLSEYVTHALAGVTPTDAAAAQLLQLLAAAEWRVKQYTGRDFVYRAAVTEYYDAYGTQDILLGRTPVATVTAVYEDPGGQAGTATDGFPASSALAVGDDYFLVIDSPFNDGLSYSGILRRVGRYWPWAVRRPIGLLGGGRVPARGAVKVTYSGGFQLIPHDLKQAVWDLTTLTSVLAPDGRPAMSESGEGYTVSYEMLADMPWHIASALAPYRDGRLLVR